MKRSPFLLCSFFTLLVLSSASRAEGLDYTAEHLLEVGMDFRYLALPDSRIHKQKKQIQFALGQISSERLDTRLAMTSATWQYRLSNSRAVNFSVFYDYYSFGGSKGKSQAEISFANVTSLPKYMSVTVNGVSGHARHYGISGSYVSHYGNGYSWQAGLLMERLQVDRYQIDISSLNQTIGFEGRIDYREDYPAFTPFAGFSWPDHAFDSQIRGHWEMILALPMPRVGFAGRIYSNDGSIDASGNTADIGLGKHIPDPYIGLKYQLDIRPDLSVDLGAGLYSLLFEPYAHKGINPPLFLSMSYRF